MNRRVAAAVITVVVIAAGLIAVGALMAGHGASPQGRDGSPAREEHGGSGVSGILSGEPLGSLTAPPYIELEFLYNDFPLVIRSDRPVDPHRLELYLVSGDMSYKLEIVSLKSGTANGSYVVLARARAPYGYYEPGTYKAVARAGGRVAASNLTVLWASDYETRLPGPSRWEGSTLIVEWPGSAGTIKRASIADCVPGAYNVSVTRSSSGYTLRVSFGPSCPASAEHTLLIESLGRAGATYYVIPVRP